VLLDGCCYSYRVCSIIYFHIVVVVTGRLFFGIVLFSVLNTRITQTVDCFAILRVTSDDQLVKSVNMIAVFIR